LGASPEGDESRGKTRVAHRVAVGCKKGIHVDVIPATKCSLSNTAPELATRKGLAASTELIVLQRIPDIAKLTNRKEPVVVAEESG